MLKIVLLHRTFNEMEAYRLAAMKTYAIARQQYSFDYVLIDVEEDSVDLDAIQYKTIITVYGSKVK